jgi:hypothetical protein
MDLRIGQVPEIYHSVASVELFATWKKTLFNLAEEMLR